MGIRSSLTTEQQKWFDMVVNCQSETLSLYGNGIGDAGAKAVADALKVNTSLTTIYLNGNEIGDAGAKAVADALKVNTSLTTIYLDSNGIGDAGAQAIADALKVNTSLTTISLGGNRIGDAGAKAVADALKVNTSLTTINLYKNGIGDAGAKAVADALKVNTSLTTISLYYNGIGEAGAKAVAEALKVNTSLTSINLDGNKASQSILDEINKMLERNKNEPRPLPVPNLAPVVFKWSMQDYLECAICRGLYENPVQLKCFHVFCSGCVDKCANDKKITCPCCKQSTDLPDDGVKEFQTVGLLAGLAKAHQISNCTDVTMCELCEEVEAAAYCIDCTQYMCARDLAMHKKIKSTSSHSITSVAEASKNSSKIAAGLSAQMQFCQKHKSHPLSLFCEACQCLVCSQCQFDPDHKSHSSSFSTLEAIAARERTKIQAEVNAIAKRLAHFKDALQKHTSLQEKVNQNLNEAIKMVQAEFSAIKLALDGRCDQLIEAMKESAHCKDKNLRLDGEQIETRIESTERSMRIVHSVLEHGTDADLLGVIPSVTARKKELMGNSRLLIPSQEATLHCTFAHDQLIAAIDTFGKLIDKL